MFEQFFHLPLQFGTAQIAGHDFAIAVHEYGTGHRADAVGFAARRGPAVQIADVVGPTEFVVPDGAYPCIVGLVERHAEDLKSLVVELLVHTHHIGVFATAGTAPRCPEIYQHHIASQRGESALVALGVVHGNLGSLHSGVDNPLQTAVDALHKGVLGIARHQVVVNPGIERDIGVEVVVEECDQEGTHQQARVGGQQARRTFRQLRLLLGRHGSQQQVVELTV